MDTFEGGKGSRTSFLQRVARLAEHGNTYYRVLSYTAEGAQAAMQEDAEAASDDADDDHAVVDADTDADK